MAWCMLGAMPLPKPMMTYCQSGPCIPMSLPWVLIAWAPCIVRSSAAMGLTRWDKQVLVNHDEKISHLWHVDV